jgi:peptide/nickel transport system substrate-binding protein
MTNRTDRTTDAISRRSFVQMASAGAAIAAFGTLPSTSLAQSAPKRGGRARIAFSDQSAQDTLNPAKASNLYDRGRTLALANTLVTYNKQQQPVPELAESWEASPDGMMWNFKLRSDVVFHNGKTMDSDDVVYSLNLHRPPNQSVATYLFSSVRGIKTDGKLNIRIEMNQVNPDMPIYLGYLDPIIVPNGFNDFQNLIGTGPFKLKSFQPGVRMLTERNKSYFKSGLPYLDEVETLAIPNAQARLNALLAGDVEFITRVDPRQISLVERNSQVKMAAGKGTRFITIVMMLDQPPFDNVDLRLALKYAIDREGVLRDVRKGYGSLGNDHPVPPVDPYYCRDMPQRAYDPDKVQYHLKRANLGNASLLLHTSEAIGSEAPDMALLFQQSAAKAGLNFEIRREPVDGYWSNIWMKRPFHMSTFQGRPTADMVLGVNHLSDAKWNETHYRSEKVDKLLNEARTMSDTAKRKELYCEVERLIADDGGTILPMFMDYLDARSAKLMGYEPNPLTEAGGARLTETLWMDT